MKNKKNNLKIEIQNQLSDEPASVQTKAKEPLLPKGMSRPLRGGRAISPVEDEDFEAHDRD